MLRPRCILHDVSSCAGSRSHLQIIFSHVLFSIGEASCLIHHFQGYDIAGLVEVFGAILRDMRCRGKCATIPPEGKM
jgi:hypothetical protein